MSNIQIKWLSIACFEMKFGNTTVVNDPCIGINPRNNLTWEDIENCDIITLTHCHWDHITDIPALIKKYPAPLLLGSLSAMPVLRWLDCNPTRIYPMDAGLELDFGEVKIKALFGRHCAPSHPTATSLEKGLQGAPGCVADPTMKDMQLLGSLEYRNYLYTYRDGTKVLMWGNDPTESQKNIISEIKPDVCILQLTNNSPESVAEIAAAAQCKVLIPHHMDLSKTREQYMPRVLELKEKYETLVPGGRFIIPEYNKWVSI